MTAVHAETSAPSPGRRWNLAEGATHSGFDLFYLLQNGNDEAARVEVRYLRPGGVPPLVKVYVIARQPVQLWVDVTIVDTAVSASRRCPQPSGNCSSSTQS